MNSEIRSLLPRQWVVRVKLEDKRDWVAYLKLLHAVDWSWNVRDAVDIPIDQKVVGMLTDHVLGYMYEGVEPPAEILPTVVNVADDLLSGREPTLRTGDYIALRTFMR
jgi:hypothetical protein